KINVTIRGGRLNNWIHHDGRAEHELVGKVQHVVVAAEIKRERAHERVAFTRDAPRGGIDVRHEAVAKFVVADENLLDVRVEAPDFLRLARAVNAEHGRERAELEPAREKFRVTSLGGVATEKSADVRVPIRDAAGDEVEAGGDLFAEHVPVAMDVTRP